ncbi:PLP-dependent aminotransferase family protein [Nonomuraea sp. NPDC050556]|uniref:aminotransferase-like domain-containing protein n=1 Tax=Nonomuraea sp. NPDC050556 TaxID=3364369 RepID=UPI0037BA6A29
MHVVSARTLAREIGDWQRPDGALADLLSKAISHALRDGRLNPGARLPAERILARELGISRTPVTVAYQRLAATGFLTTRRGSGSVAGLPPELAARTRGVPGNVGDHDVGPDEVISLSADPLATAELLDRVQAILAEALPTLGGRIGYVRTGLLELRTALARRYTEHGLPTHPGQIMVTNGAQHAIDLVARHLVRPGTGVVVENATYPGLLSVLRHLRPRVSTFSPWDLDQLGDVIAGTRSTVAFLHPDNHPLTGRTMPGDQRRDLAERTRGSTLVVDETLRELWDAAPPPAHLAAYAPDRVITIGSLSKTLWSGLRIGWIRAAPTTMARLAEQAIATDLSGSPVTQIAAAWLLDEADHLFAARRQNLRAQRDFLIDALARRCGLRARSPEGGVALWMPVEGSTTELAARASAFDLRVVPGTCFSATGALDRWLRVPYTLPVHHLDALVDRLARALGH